MSRRELLKIIAEYYGSLYEVVSHEREGNTMTENMKAVKPTLAQLMQERGLTNEQLAEKTGVNKHVIQRIQDKRFKRVAAADVIRLFAYFDVSFDMEPKEAQS